MSIVHPKSADLGKSSTGATVMTLPITVKQQNTPSKIPSLRFERPKISGSASIV